MTQSTDPIHSNDPRDPETSGRHAVTRLTVMFADAEGSSGTTEGIASATWQTRAAQLLEPQGIRSLMVRTGREALSRVESGEVHVAVLDQNLPQLSGLQVVKLLRDRPGSPPTILLARDISRHVLNDALSMKVFSVLSKPVDLALLLETLARVIQRRYAGHWPTRLVE